MGLARLLSVWVDQILLAQLLVFGTVVLFNVYLVPDLWEPQIWPFVREIRNAVINTYCTHRFFVRMKCVPSP